MMDEEHGKTGEVWKLNEGDWALARAETKVNKKVVVGGGHEVKGPVLFLICSPSLSYKVSREPSY